MTAGKDRDGLGEHRPLVLVTGTTGYVGGRLLPVLEERCVRVRCFTRRPEALRGRVAAATEIVAGDAGNREDLVRALAGVDVAYYLVHSMGSRGAFAKEDRATAAAFGEAARDAGVRRIIYLGALGAGPDLSTHLASRQEVGAILRSSGVQTIEFRASIVIGSGSLSFELIRSLVRRLPVMLTPLWVRSEAQPIAVDDVVAYLAAALDIETRESIVYEIGGSERLSYSGLMAEYARQRGLRRLIIPVPVLSPRLSSLWLGLVTPVYARVGRKLVESVRNPTVVRDPRALADFPQIRPMSARDAIARAIAERDEPPTRWADTASALGRLRLSSGRPLRKQLVDARWVRVNVPAEEAFRPIQRIGGRTGWYYGRWLWTARGLVDLVVGGAGTRRGRRHPVELRVGDALDFWRVEAIDPGRLLRLRAEMRLPGRAWLEFRVEPDGDGAVIHQTATFDPGGLAGRLYWWVLAPVHQVVFPRMLRGIAEAAEAAQQRVLRPPPAPREEPADRRAGRGRSHGASG